VGRQRVGLVGSWAKCSAASHGKNGPFRFGSLSFDCACCHSNDFCTFRCAIQYALCFAEERRQSKSPLPPIQLIVLMSLICLPLQNVERGWMTRSSIFPRDFESQHCTWLGSNYAA
jgi:hypothetical protein